MVVAGQHVVSRTLLRRWVDDQGVLVRHRLDNGHRRVLGTRGVGQVDCYVQPDLSGPMELRWKDIEDRAGPVLGRAASEPSELSRADRQVLIDLLALHIVRSRDSRELWQRELVANVDLRDAVEMLNDPQVLAELYRRRTGLVAIGIDTLSAERTRELNDLEARLGMGGEAFATSTLQVLEDCIADLSHHEVQIGVAAGDHAFLIGDTPAVPSTPRDDGLACDRVHCWGRAMDW